MSEPLPSESSPSTPPPPERHATDRQCGRCRGWFGADPDADPVALAEWWVCPACRVVLLPAR